MKKQSLTSKILRNLDYHFFNYDYNLKNSFVFFWESDYFAISKTGYIYEVEVKISKADFKKDFEKVEKHAILKSCRTDKPNCFYYCCPDGLISKDEIPKYAGLMYFDQVLNRFKIIKKAPYLHREKLLNDKKILRTLLDKFYYKNLNLTRELREFK